MALIGGVAQLTPTPGATVTLAIPADVRHIFASWTAGETETINLSGTFYVGQVLTLVIANDAVARTLTLGTGFKSIGVVVGTGLKAAALTFVSDGTNFYELSRTLAL